MKKEFQNFVVYSGSGGNVRPVYFEAAEKLGRNLALDGKTLVYGGMNAGLMNAVAGSALDAGGRVVGVIAQKIKDSQRTREDLTNYVYTDTLSERKLDMFRLSDAAIALPGGLGTTDEVMDILYWADQGLHDKPMIFVNTDHYWDDFLGFLRDAGHGELLDRLCITIDDPDDLPAALENWTIRNGMPEIAPPSVLPNFDEEILGTKGFVTIGGTSAGDICKLANAHAMAQLNILQKPVGVLNPEGKFDRLFSWLERAEKEKFVTPHCRGLLHQGPTAQDLSARMAEHRHVEIDLMRDKWGPQTPRHNNASPSLKPEYAP